MEDYYLFSSKSCPFAHRCEIAIKYLNIDIKIIYCDPVFTFANGWTITDDRIEYKTIKDLYISSEFETKYYSLPILYNYKTKKIVSNESLKIIEILDTRSVLNNHYYELLYTDFNEKIVVGTYKVGHSISEEDYLERKNDVFLYLNILDKGMALRDKLAPLDLKNISMIDIVMYCHLIRFDLVFYHLFMVNDKHLWEYPNIYRYLRRLHTIFNDSTDLLEIKRGSYTCENNLQNSNFPYLNKI
jgi:glutathionyl-hydroquinone reductase